MKISGFGKGNPLRKVRGVFFTPRFPLARDVVVCCDGTVAKGFRGRVAGQGRFRGEDIW